MNCLVNLLSRRRKFNIGFHNSVFLFAEKNEWCRLPPSSCSPWTGPPRTPVLIRLVEPSSPVFLRLFESSSCFAPTGFVVGRVIPRWENMVSFLLREPVRVARSRMLCRITTPSHKTWKPIWVFELNILILQKPERPIFVLQNSYFLNSFGFRTFWKSVNRYHTNKNSGHLDGLDQLLFGIGNWTFINWCVGIINSRLNMVWYN